MSAMFTSLASFAAVLAVSFGPAWLVARWWSSILRSLVKKYTGGYFMSNYEEEIAKRDARIEEQAREIE